jgi:hypothetical protein
MWIRRIAIGRSSVSAAGSAKGRRLLRRIVSVIRAVSGLLGVGDRFVEERFWALNALPFWARGVARPEAGCARSGAAWIAVQPAPWLAIFRQARPGKPVYFRRPRQLVRRCCRLEITCRLTSGR